MEEQEDLRFGLSYCCLMDIPGLEALKGFPSKRGCGSRTSALLVLSPVIPVHKALQGFLSLFRGGYQGLELSDCCLLVVFVLGEDCFLYI
jgi:hypothetical protein